MNSIKHRMKAIRCLIYLIAFLTAFIALSGEIPSLNFLIKEAQASSDSLTYSSGLTQQAEPARAGEIESADIHINYLDEDSFLQSIYYPEAAFMKVHFASFHLLKGDYVTVSDATGNEVYTYPRASDSGNAEGEEFWAMSVMGDTVIIELHPQNDVVELGLSEADLQRYGIVIDQYTRGIAFVQLDESNGDFQGIENIYGGNDLKDVVCYQSSHPREYERSHAVARLVTDDGTGYCTAWRVGPRQDTMMTNEHCISSQEDLEALEIWFNYQAIACGKEGIADVTKVWGNKLLVDDKKLDFALFTVMDPETISSFGSIELENRQATRNEEIYIPAHQNGGPKQFGIESDVNVGNVCRVDEVVMDGVGPNTDIGYYCDTQPGSSGAPLLARSSHSAIGINHLGGSPNSGVRMDLIWPKVKPHLFGEERSYVWINHPEDGKSLMMGKTYQVEVQTSPAAMGVKLQIFEKASLERPIDYLIEELDMSPHNSKDLLWTATWTAPEKETEYVFIAEGAFGDNLFNSEDANVGTRPVGFIFPTHNSVFAAGDSATIEVYAPRGAQDVFLSINPNDGGSGGWMSKTGEEEEGYEVWSWDPWEPNIVEAQYSLQATAHMPDGEKIHSNVVLVRLITTQARIEVPEPVMIGEETSVFVMAENARYVSLTANGIELEMTGQDETGWEFLWVPEEAGDALLYAVINHVNGEIQYAERTVTVIDEQENAVKVNFEYPVVGKPIPAGRQHEVKINSPGLIQKAELHITDENGNTDIQTQSFTEDAYGAVFIWNPPPGTYQLKAVVWDTIGWKGWKEMIVEVERLDQVYPIDDISFLVKIPELRGLDDHEYTMRPPSMHDTEIPVDQYVCAVVGYKASGGDIGEGDDFYKDRSLIQAYLRVPKPDWDSNKSWWLMVDFNTWNEGGWFGSDGDKPETWDVTLLCISREKASYGSPEPGKSIFVKRLTGLGDNVDGYDTGYDINQYVCGIAGFKSGYADINERGRGDIFKMYLYGRNGTWRLRADFKTEGPHENWTVDLICMSREIASLDGPAIGKQYFLKEYYDLGNNSTRDTGISVYDYGCGVVGFAALNGDIDESTDRNDSSLLFAYMMDNWDTKTWHIRTDFRTENHEDENWNVTVLCALRKEGTHGPWNISRKETFSQDCIGTDQECQVLRQEAITPFTTKYTDYVVVGGGYSVAPLDFRSKCGGSEYIEVYINKRDPSTGKTDWSYVDKCLRSGDTLRLQAINTYDFRGVSVIGGSSRPFELRPANNAPILENAYSKLYLDEWPVGSGQLLGPGMEITFLPSYHPELSKYEIQISVDGGTTWQACSTCGYNLNGFIQHHGTLACGYGFYRCLDRNKTYAYRMRALDAAAAPITDWSNVVSATSMEWPAHVELAPRADPGPYSSGAIVTLNLDLGKTYGKDLAVTWDLIAYSGATYTILDNTCQTGTLRNPQVITCKLQIYKSSTENVLYSGGDNAMGSLEPVPSIKVIVTGTDTLGDGFTSWGKVILNFKQEKVDPDKSTDAS